MTVPLTHGRYRHAGDTGPDPDTVFSLPEAGLTVTTPGEVIEDRVFYGPITVNAPDVTIRNCRIELRIAGTYAIDATAVPATEISAPYSLTIEDCDVNGGLLQILFCIGIFGDTAVKRCHVHSGSDGILFNGDNILLEDNWVHDHVRHPGGHCDATQSVGPGATNAIVRRNRLEAYKVATDDNLNAAMQLGAFSAPIDITVEDNYLDGGSYIINGDLNTSGPHAALFRRNRFGPHFEFSHSRSDITQGSGVDWDDTNVVDATDEPVP